MNKIKASDYLRKPYSRVLIPDAESGTFTAQILEFPGCIAEGANPAEAFERLEIAAESWIEGAIEMRQEIPPPALDVQFSGKFALRLPRSLHRQVAHLAELEGTSLNQFIVSTIAEKVGAVTMYRELAQQIQSSIVRNTVGPASRRPAAPILPPDSRRFVQDPIQSSRTRPALLSEGQLKWKM